MVPFEFMTVYVNEMFIGVPRFREATPRWQTTPANLIIIQTRKHNVSIHEEISIDCKVDRAICCVEREANIPTSHCPSTTTI